MPGWRTNPFFNAAADGVCEEALQLLDAGQAHEAWLAHVEACRRLMAAEVLARLEAAANVARALGHEVTPYGVNETCTCTGVLHLRAKLLAVLPGGGHAQIQFIGSPKSCVVAAEGERRIDRRRWRRMPLSARGISADADRVIGEFLRWALM